MNSSILHPSPEALNTFYDGKFADIFAVAANPENRELTSVEFYEPLQDMGSIEIVQQVGWDVKVPEGVSPFIAGSGILAGELKAFWLGWRNGSSLSALSVFQETPVAISVEAEDRLIQPPIVVASKKMHQYFWRPRAGGWSLLRHEFSGESEGTGQVETALVYRTRLEPVLSAAAPIPGSQQDGVVVAWLSVTDEGTIINALLSSSESTVEFVSDPIPGAPPLERQRIAVHVEPSGRGSVGFLVEHIGYVFPEFVFDPTEEHTELEVTPLNVLPDTLHSACAFYYKNPVGRRSFFCLLSKEGILTVMKPNSNYIKVVREEVDLSYDFPILTSIGGRYEAQFSPQGEVTLVPIF